MSEMKWVPQVNRSSLQHKEKNCQRTYSPRDGYHTPRAVQNLAGISGAGANRGVDATKMCVELSVPPQLRVGVTCQQRLGLATPPAPAPPGVTPTTGRRFVPVSSAYRPHPKAVSHRRFDSIQLTVSPIAEALSNYS